MENSNGNPRVPKFEDKILVCCDCGMGFVFEKGEQEFFYSKRLIEPKRCPACRSFRKATIVSHNPEWEVR